MKFEKLVLTILGLVLAVSAFAQPGGGGPPGGGSPVPITGIEYLLVSGGIFGGYKILKKKFKQS